MGRILNRVICTFIFILPLYLQNVSAAIAAGWLDAARQDLNTVLADIGAPIGDRNLLLITDAGYATLENQSTESFLDLAQLTGCSLGRRSLLTVHASIQDPLWYALYHKGTGKIIFSKWTGKGFEKQTIDASATGILIPEKWKEASAGLIGTKLFSVASICLTWAVGPPWPLLQAACFHDHFCPGVNAGYIAGLHVMEHMPLEPEEHYVFVSSPARCPADALQVMFNTTTGKSSGFAMAISDKAIEKYAVNGVSPFVVAMRVDRKKDACVGRILGFDWNKANADTGVKAEEISPVGGPKNPMFSISRVKMSRELAGLPKEKLLSYIVEIKSFSGKAALADQIAGGDPYAVVWQP